MKKMFVSLLVIAMPCINYAQQVVSVYKDKKATVEKRIEDLLKRMTLEEKILQTNQWTYGKNAPLLS